MEKFSRSLFLYICQSTRGRVNPRHVAQKNRSVSKNQKKTGSTCKDTRCLLQPPLRTLSDWPLIISRAKFIRFEHAYLYFICTHGHCQCQTCCRQGGIPRAPCIPVLGYTVRLFRTTFPVLSGFHTRSSHKRRHRQSTRAPPDVFTV